MRIKSIELQNFRCYKSSTVPFHPQFTLISASNGQGKTTLLQAIALSMGALLRSVAEYNIPGIAQSDVRLKNISSGKRTVLEKQFPCTISAEADLEPYGSSQAGWEISLESARAEPVTVQHSQQRPFHRQLIRRCGMAILISFSPSFLFTEQDESSPSIEAKNKCVFQLQPSKRIYRLSRFCS